MFAYGRVTSKRKRLCVLLERGAVSSQRVYSRASCSPARAVCVTAKWEAGLSMLLDGPGMLPAICRGSTRSRIRSRGTRWLRLTIDSGRAWWSKFCGERFRLGLAVFAVIPINSDAEGLFSRAYINNLARLAWLFRKGWVDGFADYGWESL